MDLSPSHITWTQVVLPRDAPHVVVGNSHSLFLAHTGGGPALPAPWAWGQLAQLLLSGFSKCPSEHCALGPHM